MIVHSAVTTWDIVERTERKIITLRSHRQFEPDNVIEKGDAVGFTNATQVYVRCPAVVEVWSR